MKQSTNYFRMLLASTAVASASALSASAFQPAAPGNLQASSAAGAVTMTWTWGNEGPVIHSTGFEDEQFPPEGWDITECAIDPFGNWHRFFLEEDGDALDENLIPGGKACAMLQYAEIMEDDDPTTLHQDEWLVVTPTPGSVYLDFSYYIHPNLLEDGGWRDFPDHYYVKISRDGGETWTEMWDGRWDIGDEDAVRQASLFLGEPADEETLVAFNAVSAEDDSLYYVWILDDVEFRGVDDAKKNAPSLSAAPASRLVIPANMKTHRMFTPKTFAKATAPRRIPQEEWLNNGLTTFRVYCDDEVVGDYLKTRKFTDYSNKTPGKHTFRVMAWNEAEDKEYDASSIEVEVDAVDFNPVTNLQVYCEEMENGRYVVQALWDKPEGERVPANYRVYLNGKWIGWIDEDGENERSLGQVGLYKGVYTFEVEAVYMQPDGTSERVSATATPGTMPVVENLKAETVGSDVNLSWTAPKADGVRYDVYRGDVRIAERIEETMCSDAGVPDGKYIYSVHVCYPDGEISLPVAADVEIGEVKPVALPVTADFNNGHLPANWTVSLVDPRQVVKDMYAWRFDNWFGSEFPVDLGQKENYASISGVASGMNLLESHLATPEISFPAGSKPEISFVSIFCEPTPGPMGGALFELQYRLDGEEAWESLYDLAVAENGKQTISLADFEGKTAAFRWSFLSRNSGFALVDEIEISDKSGNGVETLPAGSLVDVFSVGGVKVAGKVAVASLSDLPAGLYIVKSADRAYKVVIK